MADGGAGPACGAAAGWAARACDEKGRDGGEGVRPREIARTQTGGKDWAPRAAAELGMLTC